MVAPPLNQPSSLPGTLTFPRDARLLSPKDFEPVLRRADFKKQQKTLRIRARANRMHGARLGLIVGKRQVPKANDRNRLKRVCRETFRLARPGLPAVDIVIQVMGNSSNRVLADAIANSLEKVSAHFDAMHEKTKKSEKPNVERE